MNGTRGYIPLSDPKAVSPGQTYTFPLSINKGRKGPPGREHLHVTKLVMVFRSVKIQNFTMNSAIDAPFLSQLVESIQLNASADSPFGARRGGVLINPISLYLALTALSRMTDAPMIGLGQAARNVFPQQMPANATLIGAALPFEQKRMHGRFHEQGPFGYVFGGTNFDSDVSFTLPIGERVGEPDGMNPVPLYYLNGGGSACGCSKAEGSVTVRLASMVAGLAVLFSGEAQVFAEVIALPEEHIPLQPWVNSYQTQNTIIGLTPGISGFRALCEGMKAAGDMQLTTMTGVTLRKLTIDGYEPYESNWAECRAAWVAGGCLNGPSHSDNAEADPVAARDAYSGPEGKQRYVHPWVPIITHLGPTMSAPDFAKGCAARVQFELVGASSSVQRQVLEGIWVPNDDTYVKRGADAAGVPADSVRGNVPFGALGPNAMARGLLSGIPMVAAKAPG